MFTELLDFFFTCFPLHEQLPTLVDDDVVMWDGCAICHYLLGKLHNEHLI